MTMTIGIEDKKIETKERNFVHCSVLNKRKAKLLEVRKSREYNGSTHPGTTMSRVIKEVATANPEPADDIDGPLRTFRDPILVFTFMETFGLATIAAPRQSSITEKSVRMATKRNII